MTRTGDHRSPTARHGQPWSAPVVGVAGTNALADPGEGFSHPRRHTMPESTLTSPPITAPAFTGRHVGVWPGPHNEAWRATLRGLARRTPTHRKEEQ